MGDDIAISVKGLTKKSRIFDHPKRALTFGTEKIMNDTFWVGGVSGVEPG